MHETITDQTVQAMTASMTKDRIEGLPKMQKQIEEYNKIIAAMYSPVGTSWNVDGVQNQRQTRSITERTIDKLDKVRDLRDRLICQYAKELIAVEDWLLTVKDPEVESILRCRLIGKSYKEIAKSIYNNDAESTPRQRIRRFFEDLNNTQSRQ